MNPEVSENFIFEFGHPPLHLDMCVEYLRKGLRECPCRTAFKWWIG